MPIQVTCEICTKTFRVKDQYAGKTGMCPACGGMMMVPEPAGAQLAAATSVQKLEGSGSSVSLAMAAEVPKKGCPKCGRLNLVGSNSCFFCGAPFEDAFDVYHKWLGIPRQDQPPNHYRLLGLSLYETDVDVIQEAADQRMGHVRTHQTGPHGDLSQKILNEIATAKVCLLNPEKRAAYDAALRAKLAPVSTHAPATPRPAAAPNNSAANPMLPPTVYAAQPGGPAQAAPPAQPYPAQPYAGQPYPGQPYPGQPFQQVPYQQQQQQSYQQSQLPPIVDASSQSVLTRRRSGGSMVPTIVGIVVAAVVVGAIAILMMK